MSVGRAGTGADAVEPKFTPVPDLSRMAASPRQQRCGTPGC
ncbi:MAG: hypothetical protein ACRCXL_02025 [Dermatophilaceae bacterium]